MNKTILSLGTVLNKAEQKTINGSFGRCPGMCIRYASGIITCVRCGNDKPPKE